MKKIILSTFCALAMFACDKKEDAKPTSTSANEETSSATETTETAKTSVAENAKAGDEKSPQLPLPEKTTAISITDLALMIQSKVGFIFDANNDDTRKKYGLIPTATPLKDYDDCASELPKDKSKPMVFYCGSEMCTASHKAAEIAVAAGYDDVRILAPGIKGWVAAGEKVAAF